MRTASSEPLRVMMISAPYGEGTQRVPPLGAMNVAAYARNKLGPRIDISVHDFASHEPDDLRALDEVVARGADVIGFPVYSSHMQTVAAWAKYLRAHVPGVVLVAGGPHVTLTCEPFLRRWGRVFDFTVSGDGERPFLALLRAYLDGDLSSLRQVPGIGLLGEDDKPLMTPPGPALVPEEWANPFDCTLHHANSELIFTDRRDKKVRKAVALVTSRSCPMKCTFCAIIAMPGKWRAASSEQVIEWLVQEHRRQPFEHVYFLDANFFVQARRVRELTRLLAETLPGVTWSASSTVDLLLRMEEDMPTLVARGLRLVEMGIESGSARQLEVLGKHANVEDNLRAVELVQRYGLQIGLDFIMFYPEQTLQELRENLIFLRQAHLTQEETFDHYLNALQLYPGTPLREKHAARLGRAFDSDELPAPETLFMNEDVANVYWLFKTGFVRRYLERIDSLLSALRRVSSAERKSRPRLAQQLRLEAVTLRHVPFKVLWALCDAPRAVTVEEVVPWLNTFDDYEAELMQLMAAPGAEQAASVCAGEGGPCGSG